MKKSDKARSENTKKKLLSGALRAASIIPIIILIWAYRSEELLMTIIAALLHEGGHLFAVIIIKEKVKKVRFSPGGIVIETGGRMLKIPSRLFIVLSGPAINITLFFLSYFINLPKSIMYSNLALGLLNLLPIQSLDGGEALECIFECIMLPDKAYKAVEVISMITIFLLFAVSSYLLFFSKGNISLYMVCITLFSINYIHKE